jgi:hypothetical protein
MDRKRLLWMVGGAATAVAAAAFLFYTSRGLKTTSDLLSHLPHRDAAVVSVDVEALRRAGILKLFAAAVGEQEQEYKAFVANSGFDYARDLDRALLAFHPDSAYFLLHGRFDWKKLEAYSAAQGGSCFNGLCRMPGSSSDRKISFFPLRGDWMALAVDSDGFAASRMHEAAASGQVITSQQPVWLFLAPRAMRDAESFPSGTQLFVKAMQDTEGVLLSVGASGAALEARLEAHCRSRKEAEVLTTTLQRITKLLGDLIAKERAQPKPGDLAHLLMSGTFQQQDQRVIGRWPVEPAFLEALAGFAR